MYSFLCAEPIFNQHTTDVPFWTLFLLFKVVLLTVFMKLSWKNTMNGSFYMSVLVADSGPWAVCQTAGGHLARLMQTLSRGLWGTCCPSGGGEVWNETTPQQVTVPPVQMCWRQWASVTCVLNKWASLLLIRYQIIIRKAVQWTSGTCVDTFTDIWVSGTAVVRLLHWSNTQQQMWPCLQHQLVSAKPSAEFEIGTHRCIPSQQLPKKCVCLTKAASSHSQAFLDASWSM